MSYTGPFPITVPDGGTSATSFTAYSVVCGGTASTSALQNVSGVGTSGQVLTSNGSGTLPTWQAGGAGAVITVAIQTFTTSGTYTPTSGMIYCIIECQGGGGGGGGTNGVSQVSAGGGGSGGYSRGVFSSSMIGASQTVTIGSGGAGSPASTGGTGGTSSVGSLISCTGGTGGIVISTGTTVLGGTGGSGSGGSINIVGGKGGASFASGSANFGGAGSNSLLGFGGVGLVNSSGAAGNAATGYGAGGGGGSAGSPSSNQPGGNGSGGIVIITEFCN
jgi:hypothetical protein